jgi:hypothetical protein
MLTILLLFCCFFAVNCLSHEMHQLLQRNGCKNFLLNKVLLSVVTREKYDKINYLLLQNLIQSHYANQFDNNKIYRCYQVIVDKYVKDRQLLY